MKVHEITTKLNYFIEGKLNELSANSPIILIAKPYIKKVVDNNMSKVKSMLELIADDKDNVDIECLLNDTITNLLTAQEMHYPDVLSGVSVGNGKIKIGIPLINKQIILCDKDIIELIHFMKNN